MNHSRLLLVMLSICLSGVGSAHLGGQTLYGVEFTLSPHLWEVDPANGDALNDLGEVSVFGYTVVGSRGMATDPTDGTLYAILYVADIQFPATEGHLLVTLNPLNAAGQAIALLDQGIRDLTFDHSGQLYGVSGGPNNSTIPDHLFAIDKTTGALTGLTTVGTPGTNPRNHAIAFNPSTPQLLYHRYGSVGFETIALAPPHLRSEIGTNDIGMLINVSLVYNNSTGLFLTAENPGGPGVPYYWVTLDPAGVRTNTGATLPVILNGLAFDRDGTIGLGLFEDGFESGDVSQWSSSQQPIFGPEAQPGLRQ